MNETEFYNQVGEDRISSRQIDELIGVTRGICADGQINRLEAEFLEKWLASNVGTSDLPLIGRLYDRVSDMLSNDQFDTDEKSELIDTLTKFGNRDFELGEALKSTSLPLCNPQPTLVFLEKRFTFTGTFAFGQRKACEKAVTNLGAVAGSLTHGTDFLVIGIYATDSWKHSSFGRKIIKAVEMRNAGLPISIVSEAHWSSSLLG